MTVRRKGGRTGGSVALAAGAGAVVALVAAPAAGAVTTGRTPTTSATSPASSTAAPADPAGSPSAGQSGSCPVTVNISGDNSGLTLTPDRTRVDLGACVTFANTTNGTVDVQVDEGSKNWTWTLASGTSENYPADVAGNHDVSVKQDTPLFPSSGSGTVRVTRPAGSPSPSGSPTSSARGSKRHPASGRQSPGRQHATAARHRSANDRRRHRRHAKKTSSQISLPPLHIPPGVTSSPYTLSRRGGGSLPKVAGPQPLSDPGALPTPSGGPSPAGSLQAAAPRISPVGSAGSAGADLALAVGGLLAIGQLSALLRVLAAVDNRRRGVGRRA